MEKTIKIDEMSVSIPEYYQRVDPMPDDPKDSIPFMVQTENAVCLLMVTPIALEQTIPRNKEDLLRGVRRFLGDNQGIIAVDTGDIYAYSIVKTLKQPSGVQYILTYHKFYPESAIQIQAFFEEGQMTGLRDNVVYNMCRQKGWVGTAEDPFAGWQKDPYDESVTSGARMNMSELEEFDEMFPDFPLSMCRELIRVLQE